MNRPASRSHPAIGSSSLPTAWWKRKTPARKNTARPACSAAIAAGAATTPSEMLKRLMAELDLFVGSTPQHDDVTCLLVKAE